MIAWQSRSQFIRIPCFKTVRMIRTPSWGQRLHLEGVVVHEVRSDWLVRRPGVDFTNVFARIFRARLSYARLFLVMFCEKRARKTLVKSTPGVNFINILCKALMCTDPKSVRRYWQHDWIFKHFVICTLKSCA